MQLSDLVYEKSTTTGTGNFTLSAVTGFERFADSFSSDIDHLFFYFIRSRNADEYEVGLGYLDNNGDLVRQIPLKSTNNDQKVPFSAGNKDVTNDIPAAFQQPRAISLAKLGNAGSPENISADESGNVFTNTGATALAYNNLPIPPEALNSNPILEFSFVVTDADGIRIVAPAGVVIYLGDISTAGGGYIESTSLGSSVTLISVNETTYVAKSSSGLWNVQ